MIPTVYAGGGYGGGADTSNFYRMGIYGTAAGAPSPNLSAYLGSFGPAPVPGGAFASAPQVAASPCHAAVYVLASVFGGPNTTFSGNRVQQFDTHAPATPCAVPVASAVSGFKQNYTIKKPGSSPKPCTPCAELLASGALAQTARVPAALASATKPKKRAGVLLRFNSSAAADVTFLFSRKSGKKQKPRPLGGFIYAAQAGQNLLRFSGALHRGRPLRPGTYRVAVYGGANRKRFKLTVSPPRRRR